MTNFPWGRVIARHEIGPYAVIEYHPYKFGEEFQPDEVDMSKVLYHGYIDGRDTSESWLSLDDAIVGMMVRRHAGPNYHAIATHFMAGIQAMGQDQ